MSLRQVETLYKKLHAGVRMRTGDQPIDPGGRSDIFDKIMRDVERLLKRIKQLPPDSDVFEQTDNEIRLLLMKEIQVIIDDYVLSRRRGTLRNWVDMYGDIQYYIDTYYLYRDHRHRDVRQAQHQYGFYDDDHPL